MKAKRSNNRPKSKNNPNGKAGKVKVDWHEYNERRKAEGLNRNGWMSCIADKARGPMGIDAGVLDRRVSAILVSIVKSETKSSYWGLVSHFQKHPDDLEACELKKAYGKSRYHLRVSEIDPAVLQKIVAWMGADDADGTLLTDTSGFSVPARRERMDAKYGGPGVRMFDKMAMLQSLHGMICPVGTMDGGANDSPSPGRLLQFPPPVDRRRRAGGLRVCQQAGLLRGRPVRPDARHEPKIKRRRPGVWRVREDAALPPGSPADVLREARAAQQRRGRLFGHKGQVWLLCARPEEAQPGSRADVDGNLLRHQLFEK
ncbi:MAG: hypothetical protein OXK17_03935 [Thaumarchaeota archaeon]|nr:hypothetical protein [Nitrososphaerota archaeon]